MEGRKARESGRTLGLVEGLARLRSRAEWQTLRQTALTVASIAGFVAGVAASSATLAGYADAGVVFDAADQTILSVSPTGFAWRDGIRPGQEILSFTTALSPGGWKLETKVSGRTIVSSEDLADGALRDSLPLGLAGLGAWVRVISQSGDGLRSGSCQARHAWQVPHSIRSPARGAFEPIGARGLPEAGALQAKEDGARVPRPFLRLTADRAS
jgi:hypothetical protein